MEVLCSNDCTCRLITLQIVLCGEEIPSSLGMLSNPFHSFPDWRSGYCVRRTLPSLPMFLFLVFGHLHWQTASSYSPDFPWPQLNTVPPAACQRCHPDRSVFLFPSCQLPKKKTLGLNRASTPCPFPFPLLRSRTHPCFGMAPFVGFRGRYLDFWVRLAGYLPEGFYLHPQ